VTQGSWPVSIFCCRGTPEPTNPASITRPIPQTLTTKPAPETLNPLDATHRPQLRLEFPAASEKVGHLKFLEKNRRFFKSLKKTGAGRGALEKLSATSLRHLPPLPYGEPSEAYRDKFEGQMRALHAPTVYIYICR